MKNKRRPGRPRIEAVTDAQKLTLSKKLTMFYISAGEKYAGLPAVRAAQNQYELFNQNNERG